MTHPAAVIQLLAGRLVATLLLSLGGLVAAAAAVPEETSNLYLRHCADCHDVIGRGDGPAAGVLSPRPRDFTSGRYKFRSTPSGSLPSGEDVTRVIREGLPGTSMPGSENLFSPESVRRVRAMAIPWPWFSRLTAADAQAIAVYLWPTRKGLTRGLE